MPAPVKVVLVVDDEPGMRDMLRWYLGECGFEMKTARDGEEAVEVLSAGPVDLVITDLTMPRLNGFALLDAIGARRPRPPVIVITGFGTVEMAVLAMRRGASDLLLKPFDAQHLLRRIQEVLAEATAVPSGEKPA